MADPNEYFNWEPRAVICSRGNIKTGWTYDAEIAFGNTHWVYREGYSTRESASNAVKPKVDELKKAIEAYVNGFCSGLKKAKP